MITTKEIAQLPRTLDEFLEYEPNDGFKYEWNDGELIKTENMNKKLLFLINKLYQLFYKTNEFKKGGLFLAEQDVFLSGIQLRRPDLAYFNAAQIIESLGEDDQIPEFIIEIISLNDNINKVEDKISEYFKAGVKIVWNIFPEQKMVYVYSSPRDVKRCIENDICSAAPLLEGFEIGVDELLGLSLPKIG